MRSTHLNLARDNVCSYMSARCHMHVTFGLTTRLLPRAVLAAVLPVRDVWDLRTVPFTAASASCTAATTDLLQPPASKSRSR